MIDENCETHHRTCDCIEARRKKYRELLRGIVDRQATDEGLYFIAQYATEEYLQAGLRAMTILIEAWLDWEDSHDG